MAANSPCFWDLPLSLLGTEIVHEDLKMGSDGESDQASGTSSDEVQSPVRVRMRNNPARKISTEVQSIGGGGGKLGGWSLLKGLSLPL